MTDFATIATIATIAAIALTGFSLIVFLLTSEGR